jgi:RNA polymerase sigma factor (TIGR02999 family)
MLFPNAVLAGNAMGEVTKLLERARGGDAAAWDRVVELIYDDLKRIARGVLGGQGSATLNPTGLVHDCYLRLSRAGAEGVLNRDHFMALAARAMRQLMLNHARDRVAAKRGGGAQHTTLGEVAAEVHAEAEQLIALDAALTRLAAIDERLVRVVECRVFAGLTEEETAAAMETSLRSAQRLYLDARTQLAGLLAG